MLHDWNGRRPHGERPAPFGWSAFIVGVYLISAIILTVALDFDSQLTRIAPALFPIMALVGSMNIALRTQHKQRLERLAEANRQAQAAAAQAEQDRKQREAEAKAEQTAARDGRQGRGRAHSPGRKSGAGSPPARNAPRDKRRDRARHLSRQMSQSTATPLSAYLRQTTMPPSKNWRTRSASTGNCKEYYDGGRRSVSRLSHLVGVNPRTGQRWIDASVAQTVAPDDATNNQAV